MSVIVTMSLRRWWCIVLELMVVLCPRADDGAAENTSKVEEIIDQALHTFSVPRSEVQFQASLNDLIQSVNKMTWSDVSAREEIIDAYPDRDEVRLDSVTFVPIHEDFHITVSVFILKSNAVIPLHDHPLMYGVLKVLRGSVRVQSYSHFENDRIKERNKSDVCLPNEQYFLEEDNLYTTNESFVVREHSPFLLNDTDDCTVLTPVVNNIHEIRSYGGPAIFFDVLAPPYFSVADNIGYRKCTYFEKVRRKYTLDSHLSPEVGNDAHQRQDQNATLRIFRGEVNF